MKIQLVSQSEQFMFRLERPYIVSRIRKQKLFNVKIKRCAQTQGASKMQSLLVLKLATHMAITGLAAVQHRPMAEAQKDDGCEQTSNSLEGFNIKVFRIYTNPFDKKKIRT
jgi:hypothetical protein